MNTDTQTKLSNSQIRRRIIGNPVALRENAINFATGVIVTPASAGMTVRAWVPLLACPVVPAGKHC